MKKLDMHQRMQLAIKVVGFKTFISEWNSMSAQLKYPKAHLEYLDGLNIPKVQLDK